ncbi:unnamed protein product [Trichogramma brassicae]|uniref:Uncharacterized protein n=1 Tax=Trichogramma brassicae TaxID=86971 RepID=A0A6H5IGZ4_9HYME|nr:unnamed protein product [Trichogramma brassicae]
MDRSSINEDCRANPRGLRTWTPYLIHVRSTRNQCPILEESLYDPRGISVDDPRGYPRNFFQLGSRLNNYMMKNLFSGQPGFKVLSLPQHRVSQQPPLSIAPILASALLCQSYKGLVSPASLINGMPIFLYLFARVVELNSTEEE